MLCVKLESEVDREVSRRVGLRFELAAAVVFAKTHGSHALQEGNGSDIAS